MKNNYKKIKVNNALDAMFGLESLELKESFFETYQKINDPELVKNFWNLLVEHEKYSSRKFGVYDDLNPCHFMNWAGITFSALLASKILQDSGYRDAGLIAGITALGLDGVLFANVFYNQPKARKIEQVLEYMQVKEPELYDIALVFNGYTRDKIDTSEYDGKAMYQEYNKIWKSNKAYVEATIDMTKKRAEEVEELNK